MKNILILFILTMVITALCGLWLPWFAFTLPVIGLFYLIQTRPLASFLTGFLAVFLLYTIYAWWLDQANEAILSQRIGALFSGLSGMGLALISGVTGGLLGGFSALTGRLLVPVVKNKK
jgi:hypothetical protein